MDLFNPCSHVGTGEESRPGVEGVREGTRYAGHSAGQGWRESGREHVTPVTPNTNRFRPSERLL